jgi:hypothetical protein
VLGFNPEITKFDATADELKPIQVFPPSMLKA